MKQRKYKKRYGRGLVRPTLHNKKKRAFYGKGLNENSVISYIKQEIDVGGKIL